MYIFQFIVFQNIFLGDKELTPCPPPLFGDIIALRKRFQHSTNWCLMAQIIELLAKSFISSISSFN